MGGFRRFTTAGTTTPFLDSRPRPQSSDIGDQRSLGALPSSLSRDDLRVVSPAKRTIVAQRFHLGNPSNGTRRPRQRDRPLASFFDRGATNYRQTRTEMASGGETRCETNVFARICIAAKRPCRKAGAGRAVQPAATHPEFPRFAMGPRIC
jgi:hypothetical protein